MELFKRMDSGSAPHSTQTRASDLSAPSPFDTIRLVVARAEGVVRPLHGEGPVKAEDVEDALEMIADASREWEDLQVRLIEVAREYRFTWDQIARAQGLSSKAAACEAHRRRKRRANNGGGAG